MEKVLQVGLAVLKGILGRAAGAVWDDLWAILIRKAAEAEEAWKAGVVKDRRSWVIDRVLEWIGAKVKINIIQWWIASLILGYLVDSLIGELNDLLGHDWARKVEEVKGDVADLIPWLPKVV
jgi:hypothetical protein